jgi:transposase
LIQQRFGLRLAIRTVGEYLRRWGFTPGSTHQNRRNASFA